MTTMICSFTLSRMLKFKELGEMRTTCGKRCNKKEKGEAEN